MIFGILNEECSNFTKRLVLGQTSLTVKRYKRYLKTSLFRKTRILPLNNDRHVDDTTIFCIGSSHDATCHSLNCTLEELFTWCVNNLLTPHPGKCEIMFLSKTRLIGPLPAIYIDKSIIEYTEKTELLGVTLDKN